MIMTVIPLVVEAIETIPKNLEKRLSELKIRGRIETTKTTKIGKDT